MQSSKATPALLMCSFTSNRHSESVATGLCRSTAKRENVDSSQSRSYSDQRGRQNLSRTCDPSRELNQARDMGWMRKKARCQLQHLSLLSFDVEKDICRRRKKFSWCIANYTK